MSTAIYKRQLNIQLAINKKPNVDSLLTYFLKFIMATSLQWNGIRLHLHLTSYYMFPYKIYFDSSCDHIKTVENHRKLMPFYFVSIGLVLCFAVPCAFFQILSFIFLPYTTNGIAICCLVLLLAFAAISITTNLLFIISGDRVVEYFNALVDFDEDLHKTKPSSEQHSKANPSKPYNFRQHIFEFNNELLKLFQRNENVDYLGILISNHAIYSTLVAWCLPAFCFYFKLDPTTNLIETFLWIEPESRSFTLKLCLATFNLTLNYLMVMEACRANTLIFMFTLIHQNLYFSCTKIFQAKPFNMPLLRKYTQLEILVKSGQWLTQLLVGSQLSGAFFITLFLTSFTAIGWKLFPFKVYAAIFPATPITYLIVDKAFSYTVNIFRISFGLLKHQWPIQMINKTERRNFNSFTIQVYKKLLRVKMPIVFQCGKLVVMDQDTKTSYYNYIAVYTANVLLLFNLNF